MSSLLAFRAPRALALLSLLLGLPACGGGGSEPGPPPIRLVFTPDRLTARFFQHQQHLVNTYVSTVTAEVTATVEPMPSETTYVVVIFDQPVFTGEPWVTYQGGNAFSLGFMPDTGLAPGTYSGNVTIQLFHDAALTNPYEVIGGTVPYTVTVDPELTVTATVDGVAVGEIASSSSTAVTLINGNTIYWYPDQPAAALTLQPGQVLELEASVPVTWRSPDTFYPYGYLWQAPTVTATTLTQTIAAPPDGFPAMSGNAYIAVPAGDQFGAGMIVDIQQ